MKLDPPLSHIIARCETICVHECCGTDAYDFSPIQIASALIMWRGAPVEEEVLQMRAQLKLLKERYGTMNPRRPGVTIHEVNQIFTAEEIDSLVDEITHNLNVAIQLYEQAKRLRFKRQTQYG